MSTCRVISSRRGFSIIEAIVVLLIASLILSVVLPIVSRAVSDNLRIGMRGLDNFALSIAESSFRRLAAATVPPPSVPFEPPNLNILSGDSTRAGFFVVANETVPCAERGQMTEIRLSIESTQTGGRLICQAGEETREIVQWEVGTASFGYSLDGLEWADAWPPAASAASGPAKEITDLFAVPRRPSFVAPLLRFMISDTSTDRTPWVVQIGQPQAVEVRVEDLIGTIGSSGGAGRLP